MRNHSKTHISFFCFLPSLQCCALDSAASLLLALDVAAPTAPPPQSYMVMQIATRFQHPSGQERLRVVTTARMWQDASHRGADLVQVGAMLEFLLFLFFLLLE